jgi:hypothetical protein
MRISMRSLFLGAAALLTCGSAAPAAAQAVSLELRGGAAVGNHTPAAAGLETEPGPSLSAIVQVDVAPRVGVYGTYTRASFGCREGFCVGDDVTITSDGFGGGLVAHPTAYLWTRIGALLHGATVSAGAGDFTTDRQLGYELGAGGTIPIGARLDIVPGIGFRSHFGDERTAVVTGEVGLRVRLFDF